MSPSAHPQAGPPRCSCNCHQHSQRSQRRNRKIALQIEAETAQTSHRCNARRHTGVLSRNPFTLREKLGGRWLTAPEWHPGDFITFGMTLVHGSLDNQTSRVRLSSDTRYQRASQPADERWIGANPIANSTAGKRGRIC